MNKMISKSKPVCDMEVNVVILDTSREIIQGKLLFVRVR